MNYKLELNTQEAGSNIVFNNIIFDFFKVNIVERHLKPMKANLSISLIIFKVRTLDNELIQTKDGHGRVKLKGDDFTTYKNLIKALNSYEYRNRLINRKDTEQQYVDFILSKVVSNYAIN